jgi:exonuclease VII small subunit
MAAAKKINLEKSLADLEELVEELESRGCQTVLKEAEQKVQILMRSAGGAELADFEADNED